MNINKAKIEERIVTDGEVDELWHDGLHEVVVALVAHQGNQHLKELAHQAFKVHIVSLLICLHWIEDNPVKHADGAGLDRLAIPTVKMKTLITDNLGASIS